jgi:hypothetical protein
MRAGRGKCARILSTASTGSFSAFSFRGDTTGLAVPFSSRFLLAIHRFIMPGLFRRSLLPFQNLFQKFLEDSITD